MKYRMILLAAVCSAAVCSAAGQDAPFAQAQEAYDAGRYAEAALLYETIISNGCRSVEVEYNLGNACFRNGNLSDAVWHYRRAWHAAPRDPDIRANLHFALNAAGAAEPKPGFSDTVFAQLPVNAWLAAAAGAYVAGTLLLLAALLIPPARRVLVRLALVPLALLLVSAGGWRYWEQYRSRPEWVVVKQGATASFGPVEGSTAHYKLPPAAIVRERSRDAKGWIEVEYDGRNGWLRQEYIRRIYP